MSDISVTINGTKRLLTAGKYCDKNIVVTAGIDESYAESYKNLLEQGQSELTEITIPEGVTKLCTYCLNYYDALVTVNLPSTLKVIGSSAFAMCESLKNITLPDGLTDIYPRAFEDCYALTSVTIPTSVNTIGEYCFGWSGLTEVTFKGTPDAVSVYAFHQCGDLKTINVPWAEGAVANAPWGATNATINYNQVG